MPRPRPNAELRLFHAMWDSYENGSANNTTIAFLVIDLEKVDFINKSTKITQVGMRVLSNVDGQACHRLYLVKDNLGYKNRFCKAVNHSNFAFAAYKSDQEMLRKQNAVGVYMTNMVNELQKRHDRVVIVGWDVSSDMGWLQAGANWTPPADVQVLDLQAVHMALLGGARGHLPGLATALASANITFTEEHLHNAGNDAHYTGEELLFLGRRL